jgi:hypothetical protein
MPSNLPYKSLYRITDNGEIKRFSTQRKSYAVLKDNEYHSRQDALEALEAMKEDVVFNMSCEEIESDLKNNESRLSQIDEELMALEEANNFIESADISDRIDELQEEQQLLEEENEVLENALETCEDEDEESFYEDEEDDYVEDEELKYVITPANVNVFYNDETYTVSRNSDRYSTLIDLLLEGGNEDEVLELLDIKGFIENSAGELVSLDRGFMEMEGEEIPATLANAIIDGLYENKSLTVTALRNFWSKLKLNPNPETVTNLFNFLKNKDFSILENGNFTAYKYVRGDLKDSYTGTIDNSPGSVVTMDREDVDHDNNRTCSTGLHVGSWDYVKGMDKFILLIEVNPEHVCAVPTDYNNQKMRTCQYTTIELVKTPKQIGVLNT